MRITLAEPSYLKESISVISDPSKRRAVQDYAKRRGTHSDGPRERGNGHIQTALELLLRIPSQRYNRTCDKPGKPQADTAQGKTSESLTLELGTDNKLHIILKAHTTRTFSMPILEQEEKDQRVPELEFPVHIKTNCGTFNDSIEDAGIVAESVSFIAEPDKFTIKAEGDMSKAHVEIPNGGETVISLRSTKVKAKYSIEYLKKMINGSKLTDNVEIFFNQDYPLKLEYKVVDKVLLAFILAPRVEND